MSSKTPIRQILSLKNLPLIAVPVLLFSSVLFSGKALFWGTPATQFVPWWKWAFDTLLSGHLPLWNPLVGMGAPLIANYQSALFYPPNWLYFLFYVIGDLPALAWSQALIVCLHLIWAAVGMSVLTRRLGLGLLAQTISGLSFGLSGYLVARAWFASINSSIAWLPWILALSLDLIAEKSKRSIVPKLGIAIGFQLLAGHAQTSWYTWLLAFLWLAFWRWQVSIEHPVSLKKNILSLLEVWGSLVISIGIGAAIAAVQLLPTAEYLLQSQRASAAAYDAAMTYSFWPWRFLGFIAPNLFGNPVTSNYWGYGNFWEDAVYIGLLPFILACGVLIPGVRKKKKSAEDPQVKAVQEQRIVFCTTGSDLSFFLLIIIGISSVLALGKNTPIYPWLYDHIPTFDMFQSPTRFSIWMIFSLVLLAGLGLDRWHRPTGRGLYWTRLATAGAFAVSLGAGLAWYFLKDASPDFKPTFVPAIALAGLWALGSGALALTAPLGSEAKARGQDFWQWAVILWVSADLIVAGWGLNPGIGLDFYRNSPPNIGNIQSIRDDGRLYLLPDDEYQIKFKKYFLFESLTPKAGWETLRATLLANLNMLDAIPVVNNYDPLVPGRYARWMELIQDENIHYRSDLLDLMGVSVVEWEAQGSSYGVRYVPREGATRLRWVPCARTVPDDSQALNLIFSGQVDFWDEVVLENEYPGNEQPCNREASFLQIISENPNTVWIQTEASSPGWVVLSDVWYVGWKAWVDGESVPVSRANYLFRAVQVPAGVHKIHFQYLPIWFYVGVLISAGAWVSLIRFIVWKK